MRVLFLNWKDIEHPAAGGAEVVILELGRRLVAEGHSVTWFAPLFPGAAPETEMHGLRVIRRGNALSVYLFAWQYYRAHRHEIDLVIDSVNTLCWFTPLYVKNSVAIVYQLAADVFYYHLPYLVAAMAYRLEPLMYQPYRGQSVICISESTREDLIRVGLEPQNLYLMRLGVESGRDSANSQKADAPLFVCVGRLVPMKRFNRVIAALKLVRVHYPTTQLTIIGRGPEAACLRALATQCGMSDAVQVIDNSALLDVSGEDLKAAWVGRSWALVHPSVKEGWGLVVIEANACGTIAIVSNVSGLRDSVVADQTGFVVSADPSPEELAEAMLTIIRDRALAQRLERNALEWAKQFRWEQAYLDFKGVITQKVKL